MFKNLLKKYKNKKTTRIDSLIGQNTEIQGEVRFSGGVHIDGKIKGNVYYNLVELSIGAEVNGKLVHTPAKPEEEVELELNYNEVGE